MDDVTSPIEEIANLTRAARTFRMVADFELTPTRWITSTVVASVINGKPCWKVTVDEEGKQGFVSMVSDVADLIDALRWINSSYPKATLLLETMQLTVEKGTTTASKLTPILARAWYQVAGLPVPTPAKMDELVKARKAARKASDGELVELLKTGPVGVEEFNRRSPAERKAIDLRKANLAGAHLDGVDFAGADFEGADLSGASLKSANFGTIFRPGRLKGACLVRANLAMASIVKCQGIDTDFSGADLQGACLTDGNFRQARFVGANLFEVKLSGSDLRGTDFTDAKLDGVGMPLCSFDASTKWPSGYRPPHEAMWKGKGRDPRLVPTPQESAEPPPADAAGLLERLKNSTDDAKLDKALAMLKAERFQLYARVADDHLVGVVKSQSDPTLVYACRLAADGQYACCTQNLNVCGGLRGSPCKHLLVLVVGLAQAGQLDAATVHAWTQSSRGRKPELDKDGMAEVFIRYKGAEAGEIDWRPTETIPEDFYAM